MNKLEIIEAYWAAEAEKDIRKMLTYFDEDIIIRTLTDEVSGKEKIIAFYDDFIKTYDETSIKITNSIEKGDQIAVEWTGRFVRKNGEEKLPKGCHIFAFKKRRISMINGYFNPADF
jgi:predicted SnoaL-like aldol condensation-catalyzing enzyme